jgi:hypothetical protein
MQMTRTDLRPDDDHCELTPSLAADIKTQKIHASLVNNYFYHGVVIC